MDGFSKKLRSPDVDIRFMGLSDILTNLNHNLIHFTEYKSEIVTDIVESLRESTPNVQELASTLIYRIASANRTLSVQIFNDLNDQTIENSARAVAFKALFKVSNFPDSLVDLPLRKLIATDPLFKTAEGLDALRLLLHNKRPSQPALDQLTSSTMTLLGTIPSHVGAPTIEALLTDLVLSVSKLFFESGVKPTLMAKIDNIHYLNAIADFAPRLPSDWMCPHVPNIIIRTLHSRTKTSFLEAALKALAAFAQSGLNQDQHEAALELVKKFAVFNEYGVDVSDTADTSDSEIAESESDWFDESACVRQAASQLAFALKDSKCLEILLAACSHESDETTRIEFYRQIFSLRNLGNLDDTFLKFAKKDILRKRDTAAYKALDFQRQITPSLPSEIVLAFFKRNKNLGPEFIPNVSIDDPSPQSTEQIVLEYLDNANMRRYDENVTLSAVKLACHLRPPALLSSIERHVEAQPPHDWLTGAPLMGLPHFLHIMTEPQAESSIQKVCEFILENTCMPKLDYLLALRTINSFAVQRPQNDRLYIVIINWFGKILGVENARDGSADDRLIPILDECWQLFIDIPPEQFRSMAPIVFQISHPHLVPKVEDKVLLSGIDVPALTWAIKYSACRAIKQSASLPGQFDATLSICLSQSKSPKVHAAAASGIADGWKALTEPYALNRKKFSELDARQLELLLELSLFRSRWQWFGLDEMQRATQDEPHSKVFGSISAVISGKPSEDAPRFIALREPCRQTAFTAYAKVLQDPSTILEMMGDFVELQFPETAQVAIRNATMLDKFTQKFASSPNFVINTLVLADFPGVWRSAFPVLSGLVTCSGKECSVRSEALSSIRSRLLSEECMDEEHLESTIDLAISMLVPDANFVQTISIGPFKHKVDKLLGLRQQAIETISSCKSKRPDRFNGELLDRVSRALVENSLVDKEYDIKLSAYQLLYSMADESIARNNILTAMTTITEDMNRKAKDSAVKDDVEKISALASAAAKLHQRLEKHSLRPRQ